MKGVALVGLLLIAPRIVRVLYPQVWIEDESYLNLAFLMSHGARPYLDFPLQHFPLLEGVLAAIFRLAGPSIRTAEIVTQLSVLASSLLIYRIGRTLGGSRCGVAAALVFSWSSLVFRYHVFERELFLLVPVLLGTDLALRARRSILVLAALMAIAIACKQTAWSAVAALAAYLWLKRERQAALVFVGATVATIGALSASLLLWAGDRFFAQVILFGWRHAVTPVFSIRLDECLASLDVPLAIGAGGLVAAIVGGRLRAWMLPLLNLAIAFVILVIVKPVYWAHNGIELLPWLSLFAGSVMALRPAQMLLPAATAAVLLLTVVPVRNLNWQAGAGSVYGFGYRDRREIAELAEFVRQQAPDTSPVAAPPILAFSANRAELVPYPELAGRMEELEAIVSQQGRIGSLRSGAETRTFWAEIETARGRWLPRIIEAIRARRLPIVINSSEDDLFPIRLIDVPESILVSAGYSVGKSTPHYRAWVPAAIER